VARDAVVADGCAGIVWSNGLEVMLILVVKDECDFAVVLVNAMRRGAERRQAQRQEQHVRGRAQQPRRDSEHDAHSDRVSGACRRVKNGRPLSLESRPSAGGRTFGPRAAARRAAFGGAGACYHRRVTSEAVERVQTHFDRLNIRGLAHRFYQRLFETAPQLRRLFPTDLSALEVHFEEMLASVISQLGRMTAVDASLRDLGVRHLRYGAQPQHYPLVRDVLVKALEAQSAGDWSEEIARSLSSSPPRIPSATPEPLGVT
jgi:hemoglobin-like flavoprotein